MRYYPTYINRETRMGNSRENMHTNARMYRVRSVVVSSFQFNPFYNQIVQFVAIRISHMTKN